MSSRLVTGRLADWSLEGRPCNKGISENKGRAVHVGTSGERETELQRSGELPFSLCPTLLLYRADVEHPYRSTVRREWFLQALACKQGKVRCPGCQSARYTRGRYSTVHTRDFTHSVTYTDYPGTYSRRESPLLRDRDSEIAVLRRSKGLRFDLRSWPQKSGQLRTNDCTG